MCLVFLIHLVFSGAAQAKAPFNKGKSVAYPVNSGADNKSSTTHELVQVLREQAAWSPGYMGLARGIASWYCLYLFMDEIIYLSHHTFVHLYSSSG